MDYESLGRRIRQRRKLQKLTQEDLARAAKVSTSYIGHIERGIKRCSLETLIAIACTLNTTPDALLQDSLDAALIDQESGMSEGARNALLEIAHILRDFDKSRPLLKD